MWAPLENNTLCAIEMNETFAYLNHIVTKNLNPFCFMYKGRTGSENQSTHLYLYDAANITIFM
jgi:hypothetical protein